MKPSATELLAIITELNALLEISLTSGFETIDEYGRAHHCIPQKAKRELLGLNFMISRALASKKR